MTATEKLMKRVPFLVTALAAAVTFGLAATPLHAAEGAEPNPIPGIPAGLITAVTTLLIFLGLVAILGKYAWGPITDGLKAREDKIREDIEAAERARAASEKAQMEYQTRLEGAEARVRDLIAQAQADGQQLATRIKMQAQEEAEEAKERAVRDIENSRREAVDQIRAETAELATAIAEKILRREVNRDDQKRLIEESLNEFQTVG